MKRSLVASTIVLCLLLTPFVRAQGRCGTSPCKGGCYDSNNNGVCETVPAGYYSPFGDDAMFPCEKGSYSDAGARQCQPCEPGYATDDTKAKVCSACRPGEYAPALGSTVCLKCKTKYYLGFGSYAIFYDGVDWYCLPPEATLPPKTVSPSVSVAPTPRISVRLESKQPSAAPSLAPSLNPHSTTTFSPTASPTLQPTLDEKSNSIRRTPQSELFWKFAFPCVVVVVLLSVGMCVFFFCLRKKTKLKSREVVAPKIVWSPTSTLASKTLGPGGTLGDDDDDYFDDNNSFALNDLYGEDIPNPPKIDKTKKFNFDPEADDESVLGSISDLYFDDVSIVDSTADDYSLKF